MTNQEDIKLAILVKLSQLTGNLEKAGLWYTEAQIASLNGKNAAEMVENGDGLLVLDFLETVEHGAYTYNYSLLYNSTSVFREA